jgi:hypothetical protein
MAGGNNRLFFNQGVPLLTVGAASQPFRTLKTALLANVDSFLACHKIFLVILNK